MELAMFSCTLGFRDSSEGSDVPARVFANKENSGVLNLGNEGGAAVVSKKSPSSESYEGSVGDVAGSIMESLNESEARNKRVLHERSKALESQKTKGGAESNLSVVVEESSEDSPSAAYSSSTRSRSDLSDSSGSVESPKDSGAILLGRIQELETSLESMTPQEALEVLIFIKNDSQGIEKEVIKGHISNLNKFLLVSSIFFDKIDSLIKNATLSRLDSLLCDLLKTGYKPAAPLLQNLRETLRQIRSNSREPIDFSKFTPQQMDLYLEREALIASNPEVKSLAEAQRTIFKDSLSMVQGNKLNLSLEFCKKEINKVRIKEQKRTLTNNFKDLGKGIPASEAEALDQAKETLKEFLIKDPNLLRKVYGLTKTAGNLDLSQSSSIAFEPIAETEALRREENPQLLKHEDYVSLLRFVQLKEGHQDYEEIIELSAHLARSEEEVAMTAFSLLEKRPTLWREMTFSPQDNRLFFTEEEFKNIQLLQKVREVVTVQDVLKLGSKFYSNDAEISE